MTASCRKCKLLQKLQQGRRGRLSWMSQNEVGERIVTRVDEWIKSSGLCSFFGSLATRIYFHQWNNVGTRREDEKRMNEWKERKEGRKKDGRKRYWKEKEKERVIMIINETSSGFIIHPRNIYYLVPTQIINDPSLSLLSFPFFYLQLLFPCTPISFPASLPVWFIDTRRGREKKDSVEGAKIRSLSNSIRFSARRRSSERILLSVSSLFLSFLLYFLPLSLLFSSFLPAWQQIYGPEFSPFHTKRDTL